MTYQFERVIGESAALLTPLQLDDLEGARRSLRSAALSQSPADVSALTVEDVDVPPAFPSQPKVPVRIYRPNAPSKPRPALVHVHGGGYVLGGLENSHSRCAWLARELGVVVVSVDYRLAPESPYPAALHDVLAVIGWLSGDGDGQRTAPQRIVLHGVSAGAGLVAASTLYVRDHGGSAACFQYLSIPMLDDRQETPSARALEDAPGWNRSLNGAAWRAYLGSWASSPDGIPSYAAPARALDFGDLPPAYISVMQFDPLRDEGIAYAQALASAGVPAELHLFPGTFHGSYKIVNSPISKREADEELRVLRAAADQHAPLPDQRTQARG